jgi:hypothetical protein
VAIRAAREAFPPDRREVAWAPGVPTLTSSSPRTSARPQISLPIGRPPRCGKRNISGRFSTSSTHRLSVKSPTTRRRWRTVRTPTIRAEYVDFGEGLRTNIALSAGLAVRVRRSADHRRDGRHARGRYRDGRPQTRRRSARRSADRGGTQAITVIAPMRDLHEEPASQSPGFNTPVAGQ